MKEVFLRVCFLFCFVGWFVLFCFVFFMCMTGKRSENFQITHNTVLISFHDKLKFVDGGKEKTRNHKYSGRDDQSANLNLTLFLLRARRDLLETKDHKEKKDNQDRRECREHVTPLRYRDTI